MCAARYHRTHTSVGHIHLSLRRQTDTSRHFIPRPHRHRTVSVKCVGIEHTHARHTTCEQLPRSSSGSAGGCSAGGNSPVGRCRRRRRGAANGEGGDEGGDGGEGGEQAARHCPTPRAQSCRHARRPSTDARRGAAPSKKPLPPVTHRESKRGTTINMFRGSRPIDGCREHVHIQSNA